MSENSPYDWELMENVSPPQWRNPTPKRRYNLVVLGGGTAGLVSAVGAASLGANVALVERFRLGGDCLNDGCVPSKALLRSAHSAQDGREMGMFGVQSTGPLWVDFAFAASRMQRLRAGLSQHDSAKRLSSLGVDVFMGQGTFVSAQDIDVDGTRLSFRKAIVATGARAARLFIPGLAEAGYLTNETVFSLSELPKRLVVIGGGPLGCEMAQAFRRLGSEVWLFQKHDRLLPREDPEAAAILQARLARDGIGLGLNAQVTKVELDGASKRVHVESTLPEKTIECDHVLLAVGRSPNVEGLQLEKAKVRYGQGGVEVNEQLRTTHPNIYAAGDICSKYRFTHAADAMARIAIQNALFFGRKKASALVIPWCTYTDPEIAHVGIHDSDAWARREKIATYTVPLASVDRAILEGEADGFGRIHVERRTGRILGATLVAKHAGEMISEMTLAVTLKLKVGAIGATLHPYPTQSEVWKRLADAHNRSRLTPGVKKIFETLMRWRR